MNLPVQTAWLATGQSFSLIYQGVLGSILTEARLLWKLLCRQWFTSKNTIPAPHDLSKSDFNKLGRSGMAFLLQETLLDLLNYSRKSFKKVYGINNFIFFIL